MVIILSYQLYLKDSISFWKNFCIQNAVGFQHSAYIYIPNHCHFHHMLPQQNASSGRNSKKEQKQGILEQASFDQMLAELKPMLLIESGNYNYLKAIKIEPASVQIRSPPLKPSCLQRLVKVKILEVIALSLHVCRDWLIEGSTAAVGTRSGVLDHSCPQYMVGVIKKRKKSK